MSKKAEFLRKQCQNVQQKWGRNAFESNAPEIFDESDKKKFFVTFPFPYANGALHAGHCFTLLKADVMARHYRTKGYNVLFPFGHHGTGIPISAAANRLKAELASTGSSNDSTKKQYDTMEKMGIDPVDIPNFVDPQFWLKYFPKVTSEIDLPALGCTIDYRRSFITTDLNPHFDSFVRWQFNKLNRLGYLKFGKKLVIYSQKDGQPCSDADRSVGEGVEIVERKVALLEYHNHSFFVTYCETAPNDHMVQSKKNNPGKYLIQNDKMHRTFYLNDFFYQNYLNQPENWSGKWIYQDAKKVILNEGEPLGLKEMPGIDVSYGSGFYCSDSNLDWKPYFEPESEVISRSGDKCIVASTDQWYILYDEPRWQKSVYDHVSNHVRFTDEIVREMMLDTIKKSHPWPCSRTFGLGTKIPFDDKYLIDSLSDSTIYMAYYTIAHLITQVPKEKMDDDVWDAIFFGKESDISLKYLELFKTMHNEFKYWYPMDLRVSGKDLITNHLTMMMFNHWAIFGPEMMPCTIYTNGHLLFNGEKMSKSKGNFITLKQAIDKYGCDVTRFITSMAGDDINDGNFNETGVDSAVLSMYAEIENWAKNEMVEMRYDSYQFVDHLHLVMLAKILDKVSTAYTDLRFRDVVKYGFYELQNIRNKYINPHRDVYFLFLQAELAIISPIIPHWAEYLSLAYKIPILWPKFDIDEKYNNLKTEWINEYCQIIANKFAIKMKKYKKKKIPTNCQIIINRHVQQYLDSIKNCDIFNKDERKKILSTYKEKSETMTVIEIITHMKKYDGIYSRDDLTTWLVDDNKNIMESYFTVCYPNITFEVVYPENSAKGDPLNPEFMFN